MKTRIKRQLRVYGNPEAYEKSLEWWKGRVEEQGEYVFYLPKEHAISKLRSTLPILYLITLLGNCAGMCGMAAKTATGEVVTTLSLCMLVICMVYHIVTVYRMNRAAQSVIVKVGEDRIYCIHLQGLNRIRGYQFSNRSSLLAMDVDYLSPNDRWVLKASIVRGITQLDSGMLGAKEPLRKAIVKLNNMTVLTERAHGVTISYETEKGTIKKETVAKIYPNLLFAYTINMDGGNYRPNWWGIGLLMGISCVLATTSVATIAIAAVNGYQEAEEQENMVYEYDADTLLDDLTQLEGYNEELDELFTQLEDVDTAEELVPKTD